MLLHVSVILYCLVYTKALNLDHLQYLDPTKLQTRTTAAIQQQTATQILSKYNININVEVDPMLFKDNKDSFSIRTSQGQLKIRASTGVAAIWGFNYYLKKYCKSHIGWQVKRVQIPSPLPEADETVVASDRFRYYQNVCTVSYSFVWWNVDEWTTHVEWMALNGINLPLAPVAQEAAWARVYKQIGMTQDEIDAHFTGPAFLSWLRMGNMNGWGGPLFQSWHDAQRNIQDAIVDLMYRLGMVPVFPAFAGHVPRAFSRIYTNTTFHKVGRWNDFNEDYCCGLFIDPSEPLFKTIGTLFLKEIGSAFSHIYSADPFNELELQSTKFTTAFVEATSRAIFSTMSSVDESAVWLIQNWMFVNDPALWPKDRARALLTSIPTGRILVLDLQSEQWPQYNFYDMYFGQPFIWCMLHNFGGTLGMFGSMDIINTEVYEARSSQHREINSTMIGIGITAEGINQNYVVYDLMLESAWRNEPVQDLEEWVGSYAERRYGCNETTAAWKLLLKSVYNYNLLNKMRGKYVITRRPSFWIKPWAWYASKDLFNAFKKFVFVSDSCNEEGYYHDLVDVTRQALQYRAEQLYTKLVIDRNSNTWVFNASINRFLDIMEDISSILYTNEDFLASANWFNKAIRYAKNEEERYFYELNARNQITLWGPNGEITDYACKQWAELFTHYYIPRWRMFLSAALDAKMNKEVFDERSVQNIVRMSVEEPFLNVVINTFHRSDPKMTAQNLYKKWAIVPDLIDLPLATTRITTSTAEIPRNVKEPISDDTFNQPEVLMWSSTTTN